MKVMTDTNIVFSALLFPNSVPAKALLHIANHHRLVLCDYILNEFLNTVSRKRPDLLPDADLLLSELSYEMLYAPYIPSKLISDPKDAPILNAAIINDVDIIVSGDRHFLSLALDRPVVMTAAEYLKYEGAEG
jgi:putative PIN family toxin of toxin-antitoxin system